MIILRYSLAAIDKYSWDIGDEFLGIWVRFDRDRIEVPLCTERDPRLGSFCLSRITGAWVVAPSVFVMDQGKWWAKGTMYDKTSPYEFLTLLSAPRAVDDYLEYI